MRKHVAAIAAAVPLALGGAARASGGGNGGEDVNFVVLAPISVPIVESDRVEGKLYVKLVIDAKSAEAAASLEERLPELRAVTVAATLEFARLNASSFRPVDAERLDRELHAALAHADPGVARVLIVEVAATRG